MNDSDAYQGDMERIILKSNDKAIEQVIDGTYEGPNQQLVEVSQALRKFESDLGEPLDQATQESHIATMLAEAEVSSSGPATAATAAVTVPVRKRFLPAFRSKLALGGAAILMLFGALAATGSLPRPVQAAVSHAVDNFGIHLPEGESVPEDLPEQTEGSAAEAVTDLIRRWRHDVARDLRARSRGCEFGHAVSRASGENPGPCRDKAGGPDDKGRPDHVQTGKRDGTPTGPPDETGRPDQVQTGKQEGTPTGPPDDVKTGKQDGTGTPTGPPPGAGPPDGTGGGGQPDVPENGEEEENEEP